MIDKNEALKIIQNRLSAHRFKHCQEVARVAFEMAVTYGVDSEKAYMVGLLHDYAKGISGEELLNIAEKNGLIQDEVERKVPDILHAPVGAYLLQKELEIVDPEMIEAVRVHTLGSLAMTDLDKIIFLADMIEPGRDYPGLERLQCVARKDLDQGMLLGLDSTIKYCLDEGRILHPQTIMVRNLFLEKVKS